MEAYERIRELRKKHLHMSQTEFGERLGVNRSVIKNIELNTLSRPEQKLPLLRLICKEFNVSEDWLLNGVGPMFEEAEYFSLDAFARERGMSDIELEIIKAYLELDEPTRRRVMKHFREKHEEYIAKEAAKKAVDVEASEVPSPAAEKAPTAARVPELTREVGEDVLANLPKEELEEIYKKEVLHEPSRKMSTFSTTTDSTGHKEGA